MRQQLVRLCLTGALALLLTVTTAAAQERGPGRRGGGFGGGFFGGEAGLGKLGLLLNPQVRDELKLSEDQQAKVREAFQNLQQEMRDLLPGGQDLSREERIEQFQKTREQREKLVSEAEQALDDVLTEEQMKRLNEIALQVGGPAALAAPRVAEKLNLSQEQQEKIRRIVQEQGEKRRELFGQLRGQEGERPDFAAMREKMEQIEQQTREQVLAVLSDEQKQQWEQLKGKPFELERRGFGGPGGGRPGRRPGGQE